MAIENRNLLAGTRLVANYKKQRYVCTVEANPEGEGVVFVLEDGKRFKSPSAAASAVMGGNAANGWRFWSVEGEEPKAHEGDEATSEAPEKPANGKATKSKAGRQGKLIYLHPNQQGLAEGQRRWMCVACLKGFVAGGEEQPQACPKGHRVDDPELTAEPTREEAAVE